MISPDYTANPMNLYQILLYINFYKKLVYKKVCLITEKLETGKLKCSNSKKLMSYNLKKLNFDLNFRVNTIFKDQESMMRYSTLILSKSQLTSTSRQVFSNRIKRPQNDRNNISSNSRYLLMVLNTLFCSVWAILIWTPLPNIYLF